MSRVRKMARLALGNLLFFALTVLAGSGIAHAQNLPSSQEHTSSNTLIYRPDDRRPEDQLTLKLLNRPLTIGGELETESRYESNFSLSEDARDDVFLLAHEVVLEFFYPFTEDVVLFLEGVGFSENELYAGGDGRASTGTVELGEAWLYLGHMFGSRFSLQFGRQLLFEERDWWWDDYLDAIRFHYDDHDLHAELSVAQEVGRISTEGDHTDPEDRDILRLLGHTEWSWIKDHQLDGFLVYHHDHSSRQSLGQRVKAVREDEDDARLLWLGARASGECDYGRWGELEYLLEGAWVGGREVVFDFEEDEEQRNSLRVSSRSKHQVTGWALNSSVSWETEFPGKPTFTLEYALGSGDPTPEHGTDRAFRQTGLHSNDGRFDGVNYFDYYGVLLQPELSNLHIWTAAVGFEFWRSSSIEFVYHLYHQVHPTPFLRSARIDADPTGKQHAIGQEWDIIIGLQEWKQFDVELIGGIFRAGPAYGSLSGETALSLLIEVDFNF